MSAQTQAAASGIDGSDAPHLMTFVDEVFNALHRADQRRWAMAYLQGLLTVPGKKTLQRMAGTAAGAVGTARGLQQFINGSPWDWAPVRRALARRIWAGPHPAQAWVVELSVIPKRGDHSVGVQRRFIPSSGRTLNCQVAIGLYLSNAAHTLPVHWRILLEDDWVADDLRRRRARIPADVQAGPLWRQIPDLVADIIGPGRRGLPGAAAVPLVADLRGFWDLGSRDVATLAHRLAASGLEFTLEVRHSQLVGVPPAGGGSRVQGAVRSSTAGDLFRISQRALGTGGPAPAGLYCRPVTLSTGPAGPERPLFRLVAGSRDPRHEPTRYWLTNRLRRPPTDVLELAGHVARARAAQRRLEADLGIHDFEGRSFPGWHHHVTMVSAAYAYREVMGGGAERFGGPVRLDSRIIVPEQSADFTR